MGKLTIRYADCDREFPDFMAEIKILFSFPHGGLRVFRMSNCRRPGCCTLCIFWKKCPVVGVTEEMDSNYRVLECPHFSCNGFKKDRGRIMPAEQAATIFQIAGVVASAIQTAGLGRGAINFNAEDENFSV